MIGKFFKAKKQSLFESMRYSHRRFLFFFTQSYGQFAYANSGQPVSDGYGLSADIRFVRPNEPPSVQTKPSVENGGSKG